jgi:hypothetical protein
MKQTAVNKNAEFFVGTPEGLAAGGFWSQHKSEKAAMAERSWMRKNAGGYENCAIANREAIEKARG